nr:MmgE/PrpD family protein [Paraburkholderia sacchari]
MIDRSRSTPYFAAVTNASASHFVEQDDVHNGSVFHPATVVFPVTLAQALGASGREFIAASVAGYDPGNTLSREELATKFVRLAAFSHAASEDEAHALLEQAWRIADAARLGALFEAVL